MTKVVCLDTQLLQWGLLKNPSYNNGDLVEKAQDFLDWLDKQNPDVVIPSIVVGELLVTLNPDQKTLALNELVSKWKVIPYDILAAMQFSVMRDKKHVRKLMQDIRDSAGQKTTRATLTADLMIVATAIAHQADVIYTWDDDILKFANGHIDAQRFTDIEVPRRLPRDVGF